MGDVFNDSWKPYHVGDILTITNGKGITKEEINQNPGDLRAIQSGEINNGCLGLIDKEYCISKGYAISEEMCLTVARSGSAGTVLFHPYGCVVGDSAKILTLKDEKQRCKEVYLFLQTVLMHIRYKYSFGVKVTEDGYGKELIMLPSKENEPDWEYMKGFIREVERDCMDELLEEFGISSAGSTTIG